MINRLLLLGALIPVVGAFALTIRDWRWFAFQICNQIADQGTGNVCASQASRMASDLTLFGVMAVGLAIIILVTTRKSTGG